MTINRQVGYSAPGQQYMLSIDGGAAIPLENVSITENGRLGGGELIQPPRETLVEVTTQGNGMMIWHPPPDELDRLRARMTRLESWLSGVQPVDDPDVPGRSFCGVCGHVLPGHVSDCPAAPN